MLSTSIYDLVLLDVCHFHLTHTFLSNHWDSSKFSPILEHDFWQTDSIKDFKATFDQFEFDLFLFLLLFFKNLDSTKINILKNGHNCLYFTQIRDILDPLKYRNWLGLNIGIGIETQFRNSGIWYRNWKPYLLYLIKIDFLIEDYLNLF